MTKILATGKSIEEAVRNGLATLQVSEDRVSVRVIQQPSKGLFGLIGSKEAQVELELLPEIEPPVENAPPIDFVAEVKQFIVSVGQAIGIEITVRQVEVQDYVHFILESNDDLGVFIGRRGQTLDALQYLVNIVANRYADHYVKVTIDAEDYRLRRRITLEKLADRLAIQVIKTRQKVELEPMSALDRKAIHARLQSHPKIKTFSVGEDTNRRIVIALKN